MLGRNICDSCEKMFVTAFVWVVGCEKTAKKTADPRNRTWVSSATTKCTNHYTRSACSDIHMETNSDKTL